MRFLLDTSVWLWLLAEPARIPPALHAQLEEADATLFLSAASSWEIAIKYSIGKLSLPEPPESYVPRMLEISGTTGLLVKHVHALRVGTLPHHHRDPFDRLLVAQAQVERLVVISADAQLARYEVEVVMV